jgi:hypothetical protein
VKPQSIGRALGIGLRVAGRMAGQRIAAGSRVPAPPRELDAAPIRAAGKTAGQVTRRTARGVSGFLKPFRRVGGILWLEVMGVFFFLPVVVFAPVLWKTHHSWAQGPDHRAFLIAAVIVAIFLYLSATSFWRAWHR